MGTAQQKVNFSYICSLDCGDVPLNFVDSGSVPRSFEKIGRAYYNVKRNAYTSFCGTEATILSSFYDCYSERIKPRFLSTRTAFLVELKPIPIASLALNDGTPLPFVSGGLAAQVVAEVSELGVILFHIFFSRGLATELERCVAYKNPANLLATIDIRWDIACPVRLQGIYSIPDVIRFIGGSVIACLLPNKGRQLKILKILNNSSKTQPEIYAKIVKHFKPAFDSFPEFDYFPIFAIESGVPSAELHNFIDKSKRVLRALMTDDKNWDKKSEAVVSDTLSHRDFATRATLAWYVHHLGSVKIFGSDFETPILTSRILAHFELGIVIAMKFFLYRTIFRLHQVLGYNWTPQKLASFRRREIEILHNFFNLDVACKDTTATRISQFLQIIKVDDSMAVVNDRFAYLNNEISAKYQQKLSRVQVLLTIVFGGFGAAQICYAIFNRFTSSSLPRETLISEVFQTTGVTFIVVFLILIVVGVIHK